MVLNHIVTLDQYTWWMVRPLSYMQYLKAANGL